MLSTWGYLFIYLVLRRKGPGESSREGKKNGRRKGRQKKNEELKRYAFAVSVSKGKYLGSFPFSHTMCWHA